MFKEHAFLHGGQRIYPLHLFSLLFKSVIDCLYAFLTPDPFLIVDLLLIRSFISIMQQCCYVRCRASLHYIGHGNPEAFVSKDAYHTDRLDGISSKLKEVIGNAYGLSHGKNLCHDLCHHAFFFC